MPLYEYTCSACDRPFEALVSSPALADSVACRRCGSVEVRRLISSFASHTSGPSTLDSMVGASRPSGGGCACGGGGCACGGH